MLPRIFKRPVTRTPSFVPELSDDNLLVDKIKTPPVLAPQAENIATAPERVPVDPNAPLPPNWTPANMADTSNLPLTPMPDRLSPEEIANIGAPPMAKIDKYGVPKKEFIGEGSPDEEESAYSQSLRTAKPKAAKGWWDRWIKPALVGGGLGFLAGGPGGALGGAVANTLRSAFDPTSPNKDRIRRAQPESDANLARIGQEQKIAEEQEDRRLRREKLKVDTNLNRKRLAKEDKPQAGQVRDTGKGFVLIDPVSGVAKPIVDDKGIQVTKLADNEELVADPSNPGVFHKTKNGKPTGVSFVAREGYGYIPSGQAITADATRENKVGEAQFTNEQIDQQIASLKQRQQAMGGSPPLEVEKETTSTNDDGETRRSKQKTRNPDYEDWRQQYNKIQDQIDELERKRKFVPKTPPKLSKPKSDPLGLFR